MLTTSDQKPYSREPLQPSNAPIRPLISPRISNEFRIQPSQEVFFTGRAGTTSATGWPNRVIRTDLPVRRTSSRTARHVALNLEMAISFIFNLYYGP